jgi:peptidoglycan/xylan/chitin deacetylase (PgdA/CDA1 family)
VSSLWLTTSWDDGHPLDLRIAELLARYGFRGTFYVPRRNIEGRSVLSKAELRELGAQFEIGGHTFDHVRLDAVPDGERQIRSVKHAIEDELGRSIRGFCYPGGVHDPAIRDQVRAAGYEYARTTQNLSFALPADPFLLGTSLQLYPHSPATYVKNFIRGQDWRRRARNLERVLHARSFGDRARDLLVRAIASGGMFHLWGHSWELEEQDLWDELEAFFELARDRVPRDQRVDNAELIAAASAFSKSATV